MLLVCAYSDLLPDSIAKDLDHTLRVWFEWWPESTTAALRENLANIAYDLSLLAQQRFAQYLEWTFRNSNNRGRVLQHRGLLCLADGLAQLAAHVVDDEESRGYRVVTNNVVAQIAERALLMVQPTTANLYDIADRWLENVELWLAHDAQPKHGCNAYEPILRGHRRALLRARSPHVGPAVTRS